MHLNLVLLSPLTDLLHRLLHESSPVLRARGHREEVQPSSLGEHQQRAGAGWQQAERATNTRGVTGLGVSEPIPDLEG